MANELAALRSQMRIMRAVALGSLAVSMVVLALVGHIYLGGHPTKPMAMAPTVAQGRAVELWGPNNVIVPYGFKACDSTDGTPQMAPIRKNGEFLFLSGILGYETPCKSAVKDVGKQIEASFKWAGDTLTTAGVTWADVMSVTSYHVNLTDHQEVFAQMREQAFPAQPYPAWTAVGVKSLYFEHEVFEMTIIARIPKCSGLECDR